MNKLNAQCTMTFVVKHRKKLMSESMNTMNTTSTMNDIRSAAQYNDSSSQEQYNDSSSPAQYNERLVMLCKPLNYLPIQIIAILRISNT